MQRKYNILVTASGGDIAQSVAKILRRIDWIGHIIGTDASSDNAALHFVDSLHTVPKAESPEYLTRLANIADKERVDFIIPVSEPELRVLWNAQHNQGCGPARLVVPGGKAVPVCMDKFDTVEFLKSHRIDMPWTVLTSHSAPIQFPCVLKDRWSWGSRNLQIIDDADSASFFAKRRHNAIFQEKLLPSDQEYTCGIFRGRKGNVSTIIFKRSLIGGHTGKGAVVNDKEIEDLCRRVALVLDLRGSINLQLIKTEKGPIPFEINPRFSSTVMFRELLGFRDVLWSLLDLLGIDFSMPSSFLAGTRIYRIYDELIFFPKEPSDLNKQ